MSNDCMSLNAIAATCNALNQTTISLWRIDSADGPTVVLYGTAIPTTLNCAIVATSDPSTLKRSSTDNGACFCARGSTSLDSEIGFNLSSIVKHLGQSDWQKRLHFTYWSIVKIAVSKRLTTQTVGVRVDSLNYYRRSCLSVVSKWCDNFTANTRFGLWPTKMGRILSLAGCNRIGAFSKEGFHRGITIDERDDNTCLCRFLFANQYDVTIQDAFIYHRFTLDPKRKYMPMTNSDNGSNFKTSSACSSAKIGPRSDGPQHRYRNNILFEQCLWLISEYQSTSQIRPLLSGVLCNPLISILTLWDAVCGFNVKFFTNLTIRRRHTIVYNPANNTIQDFPTARQVTHVISFYFILSIQLQPTTTTNGTYTAHQFSFLLHIYVIHISCYTIFEICVNSFRFFVNLEKM